MMCSRALVGLLVSTAMAQSCVVESRCVSGYARVGGSCQPVPEEGGPRVLDPCDRSEVSCDDCLLDYQAAQFSRSSSATLWVPEADCFRKYQVDQRRMFPDGSIYLEGRRTNYARGSDAFDHIDWRNESVTVSRSSSDGPFGLTWEFRFQSNEAYLERSVQELSPGQMVCSAFHGPLHWRVEVWRSESERIENSFEATSGWSRDVWDFSWSSGRLELKLAGGDSGNGATHQFYGLQLESGFFPSQYIETTELDDGIREAEELTFDGARLALQNGDWQVELQPAFSSDDLRRAKDENDESRAVLFEFGAEPPVAVTFEGAFLCIRDEGGNATCTNELTFARNAIMTASIVQTNSNCMIEVTGDDVQVGTAKQGDGRCWLIPDGGLRVGAATNGEHPFFGRIGSPKRL